MTVRTMRWVACDFPGCPATFELAHYRHVVANQPGEYRSIRDAAATDGWDHTEQGDDLCKRHADAHRERPVQPALFPAPGGDHPV